MIRCSDPASGTEVSYRNDGTANTGFVSGQVEPLGQSVALTDPEPPNEPQTYEQHLFFASEPEWQCSVPEAFYGGFQGRPDHCQNRVLMSFDRSLDQIYGFSSFDTRRIETYAWGTAAVKGSYEATITTEQKAMQWVLSITQKPTSGGGSTGADSGYSYQSGAMQWDVQVNAGYDTIGGVFARLDASNPGDPLGGTAKDRRTLNLIADKALNLLKTNKKCRDALSSKSLDSLSVLEQLRPNDLYENFGLINAGDRDNDFNAWTFYGPIQGVTRGAIEFYKDFFKPSGADSAMGDGLVSDKLTSLEDRQILVVLHEVGHADRKYVHPNEMNWVQKQGANLVIDHEWDNATVNQFIYDNCFKK